MKCSKKIDSATLALLRDTCVATGSSVKIVKQLDRCEYLALNKVLAGLGGKWNAKAKAHLFPFSIEDTIAQVVASEAYVDRKQSLQFFPTPANLAYRMRDLAELTAWDDVLEPSAGMGAIVSALGDDVMVTAVEIDATNARVLEDSFGSSNVDVVNADFLDFARLHVRRFDRVVMNPPFSGNQDIRHVRAAFDCLRYGGRLVSVMSLHHTFAEDKESVAFRAWLCELDVDTYDLSPDTFKSSGTSVNSVLVVIDKPAIEDAA